MINLNLCSIITWQLSLNFYLCRSDDDSEEDDRLTRHRRIHEPEVLSDGDRAGSDDDKDRDDDMERWESW